MSYFDDASLAFLPSGAAGKDGKAYSIKPTDGTGDFTFSRGSNLAATRVGPGPDYFIEKGRENLLTYSNDFSNSDWNKINGLSVIGQTATDPFGVANNAWSLNFDGTVNGRIEKKGLSVAVNGVYNYSVYLRVATGTQVASIGHSSWGLTAVTITTQWQRFEGFKVAATNTAYIRVRCDDAAIIEVFGYQFESGLVATEYIESGATKGTAGILENTPRFDYSNGASCPSLLLEPSRTNLVPSEYFGAGYTLSGAAIINNNTTSPEGLQNATKIYPTASGNYKHIRYGSLNPSTGVHTFSIFAKAGELDHLVLIDYDGGGVGVDFNLSTGVANDSASVAFDFVDMVDYGNGWYRCVATATNLRFYWILSDNGGVSVTANGTDGLYIYAAQAEANAYPTSYIPNHSGGTITRAVDVISKDLTSVINNNQMTMFLDVKSLEAISTVIAADNFGDLRWYHQAGNRFRFYKIDDADWVTNSFVVNDGDKIALTLTDTQAKLFVNGSQVGTTFALTTSFQNFTNLSYNVGSSKNELNQLLIFRTALSDADCITLTT